MLVFLCRPRLHEVNGGWWFVSLLPGLKVSLCVCETERIATSLRSSVLLRLNETGTYVQYSYCHSIAETVDLALDLYILSYEVNQKVESVAGRCIGEHMGAYCEYPGSRLDNLDSRRSFILSSLQLLQYYVKRSSFCTGDCISLPLSVWTRHGIWYGFIPFYFHDANST